MEKVGTRIVFNEDDRALTAEPAIRLEEALIVADLWARRAKSYDDRVKAVIADPRLDNLRAIRFLNHASNCLRQMSKELGDLRINGS